MARSVDHDCIEKLYNEGLSDRSIAREMGIHHGTVGYWRKKHGKKSNADNSFEIEIVGDDKAKCSKCKAIQPLDEFQYGRKGKQYEYRYSYCKSCRKKQQYLNLNNDITKFLKSRLNRIKKRCAENNIDYNLSLDWAVKKYKEQGGNCFYTNCQLNWGVGKGLNPDSLSFDRINPDLGYTEQNVIICSHRANTIKSNMTVDEFKEWMPLWFKKIEDSYEQDV